MARTLLVSKTLHSPPWADDHALVLVYTALNDSDRAPLTLLVGGCVRNALMGRPLTDIDLATILTPDQVTERATAAGFKVVPTGLEHGTVTVVVEGQGFEVTTLRADIATDGRRATVAFTDDWAVDAARRDFTMNALYADLSGNIYDPLKTGLADARAGVVRFVGDSAARIAEDYLRILRFFRFHAHYGAGEVNREAVTACALAAEHLTTLSRERVTGELLKWLAAPGPLSTLRTAYARGVMRYVLPGACDLEVLDRVIGLQGILCHPGQATEGRATRDLHPQERQKVPDRPVGVRDDTASLARNDTLLRLLVLLDGTDPQMVLRLSNKDMDFMAAVEQTVLDPARSLASLKRDIYWQGRDVVFARLTLDLAEMGEAALSPALAAIMATLSTWVVPKFPTTAAEVMAREGLKPGPALGKRLKKLEEEWVNENL